MRKATLMTVLLAAIVCGAVGFGLGMALGPEPNGAPAVRDGA